MPFVLTLLYIVIGLISPDALPAWMAALRLNLILGVLIIFSVVLKLNEVKFSVLPENRLILGILVTGAFAVLHMGFFGGLLPLFLGMVPIFAAYYFVMISSRSLSKLRTTALVLICVAFFILGHAVYADMTKPPLAPGVILDPYLLIEGVMGNFIYRYRGLGVLADPNDLAQFFVTVIPLLWLRWTKGKGFQNFLLTVVPMLLLAVGVYLTHSRGGTIAFIAVVLFGLKDKLGLIKSAVFAGVLLVALLALNIGGGRDLNSDDGRRVSLWSEAIVTFRQHPLFGIGIGRFSEVSETHQTAHNSFVLALAETGIAGYFCWFGTVVVAWTSLSDIIRREVPVTRKRSFPSANGYSEIQKGQIAPSSPWLEPQPAAAGPPSHAGGVASASYMPLRRPPPGYPANPNYVPAYLAQPAELPTGTAIFGLAQKELSDGAAIGRMAQAFRVSLVGLLASSFFISRTFSMVFYILLGMAASLKMIYYTEHPDAIPSFAPLLKRILIIMPISIILIYVFIRVKGLN